MKEFLRFLHKKLTTVIVVSVVMITGLLAAFATTNDDGTRTYDGKAPKYTEAQEKAYCDVKKSNDEAIVALSGIDVPQDITSGCDPTDKPQMGSLTYYDVDESTPDSFYNAVNGKGFNEGYGYQCVAGFKEFMYALSGKYIATSNGGASGYASQQSQIEPLGFEWHSGASGLQNGDWAIWTNGQYGHVSMYYNGKWFGQNQYAANPNTGNVFNVASISTSGIAGYYRPNIYKTLTPPVVEVPKNDTPKDNGIVSVLDTYTTVYGDTLGAIAFKNGWYNTTDGMYGDSGYTQRLAQLNSIPWRGLIYPGQVIKRAQ